MNRPQVPPNRWLLAGRDDQGARSLPLELAARVLFRTILLFSLYLLVSGHDSSGGGFSAGLVAGTAFVLRYVAGGDRELRAAVPLDPGLLLGAGLLVLIGTGAGAWAFGQPFGDAAVLKPQAPVLGEVKLVTSLGVDVGLYLLVAGAVLEVLRLLGVEAAPEVEVPEGQELR